MKKILLADDEDILRMLIVDTLELEGYEIDEAEDGEVALALFEENNYDLLILDYMMPQLTGLEVLQKVKLHESKKSTPVLMLTAKSQQQDIQLLMNEGANYFMAKPFSPVKLVELIEDVFHD